MNFKEKFFNVFKKDEESNTIISHDQIIIDFNTSREEKRQKELDRLKQICIDKGLTLYEISTKYNEYYSQGLPDINNNFISFYKSQKESFC